MLVNNDTITNSRVLSLQASGVIALTKEPIIDPDKLKIIGFVLSGGIIGKNPENILDVSSIREFSKYGMVVDSADEFIASDDVIKIKKALDLNFKLLDIRVVTKKGTKLGKVSGYTLSPDDFMIQQIIVKRPTMKMFFSADTTSDLVISRREIVKISDDEIVVKDEERTLIKNAENEDFIPNYVNPFRKNAEQDFVPAQSQSPDEQGS